MGHNDTPDPRQSRLATDRHARPRSPAPVRLRRHMRQMPGRRAAAFGKEPTLATKSSHGAKTGARLEHDAQMARTDPVWAARDAAAADRSLQNLTELEIDQWAADIPNHKLSETPNFSDLKRLPEYRADIANRALTGDELKVGLDHTLPKASGDNWQHALDGDKLQFLMQTDNTKLSHLERKDLTLRR